MNKRQFASWSQWRAMSPSERASRKHHYQRACAALDANTADQIAAGIHDETGEYLRLNDAVIRAEAMVPWWVAQIELHWRPRFTQRCSACPVLIWAEEPHVTVNWYSERFGRKGKTVVDDAVAVLVLCMSCKTRLGVNEQWLENVVEAALAARR